nr:NACHT domain-containing protein [Streptomyces sp. WAC04770]
MEAPVIWIDDRLDVALLEAVEPVRQVPLVRLGVVETLSAIPRCEITGFPRVQRYGRDERLEVDQYTATVLPMAGRVRDVLVCALDSPPPFRPGGRGPALAGLSGGPVLVGDVLLGVAREVPQLREGCRIECVPLHSILAAPPFRLALQRAGTEPRCESVYDSFLQDQRYEVEYAQALGAKYRRTKIFGLDELSRHDSEWDLDTAYLSLEARAQDRTAQGLASREQASPLPQHIDALLPGHPRVLLRGDAGAGKTTLLWWLAAHASARTLADNLAPLNGLVPFVVPLRSLRARGGTFPGPAELSNVAGLVIDRAPEGWAGRVLAAGRALLLVDGLDEVPPEDREQAHAWLSQLLRRYPETRCVTTVRPLAVEPDWLRSEGFTELRLLPMRNKDIQAFVASWHRAARLSEQDDADRLDELERDLALQFDQNPALRNLARTPLLCAVICALHRRRDGFLPETRWALYDSALKMLLGHRDVLRGMDKPEGIGLSPEEHTQLLQQIAVWLVREGRSVFTRDQALRQLGRALAGMERVSTQGPPAQILTFVLNRSGLLQEFGTDTYQFIHRTFQDYLAAKEFIEGDHLNELLRHADEETWQDVILLAAGHCGRREIALLVGGLLNAGLRHEAGTEQRTDIHLLAALCAQHAVRLDGPLRETVRRSTAALFPPDSDTKVRALARLGPAALTFLPDPRTAPDMDAPRSVSLILSVGGAPAIPHARAWAMAHPWLGLHFVGEWERFPPEEYAVEVLAHCDLFETFLRVSDRNQLRALRHLPSLFGMTLCLDLSDAELGALLEGTRLRALLLKEGNRLPRLSSLKAVADSLSVLDAGRCSETRDFPSLAGLHKLVVLSLDAERMRPVDLAPLADLPALWRLRLRNLAADRLSGIAAHPGVTHLTVTGRQPLVLDGLHAWKSLKELEVSELAAFDDALDALREHSRISVLGLTAFPWARRPTRPVAVPTIRELSVQAPDHGGDLGVLRPLFPGVTHLRLDASARRVLDLTPLHSWPGLRVQVNGLTRGRLIGAEELGDRLNASPG